MATQGRELTPVTLHFLNLEAPDLSSEEAASQLTSSERERAAKLADEAARRRFAIGRATLRRLLGAPAASGDFVREPGGKPYLPDGPEFSFSASGNWALIGIAASGRIGVDIEVVRDVTVPDDWAKRFPALGAMRRGDEQPGDGSAMRFLRAWTRLEAAIKRDGGQLGQALDLTGLPPDVGPSLTGITDLDLGGNVIGALACQGEAVVELRTVDPLRFLAGP